MLIPVAVHKEKIKQFHTTLHTQIISRGYRDLKVNIITFLGKISHDVLAVVEYAIIF